MHPSPRSHPFRDTTHPDQCSNPEHHIIEYFNLSSVKEIGQLIVGEQDFDILCGDNHAMSLPVNCLYELTSPNGFVERQNSNLVLYTVIK